jgi:hypothetical protein
VNDQVYKPSYFTPGKKVPGTLSIGGSVGPRVGVDALDTRRIFLKLPIHNMYWTNGVM